jgi:hypothetical protein
MKNWLWILLCSIALGSVSFVSMEKPKPFAVVELFTAEGCSSCPAADDLLKEMTEILRKEGKEVIGLSFHVTYWNKQGWEDPYSQEIFTERQKKYVQRINAEQLYTPQAVVNGAKEFIGSNPIAFRNEVTEAVGKAPAVEIVASAKMDKDNLVVEYTSNKVQPNLLINIALVETNVKHFIPRGENKNLTLKHYNIVRSFSTSTFKTNDRIVLSWPDGLVAGNSSVVLYAQHSKSLKIVGATEVSTE